MLNESNKHTFMQNDRRAQTPLVINIEQIEYICITIHKMLNCPTNQWQEQHSSHHSYYGMYS